MSRTESWSRHVYPVQSLPNPSKQPLPTPPLEDEEARPVQLPKSIRAVKNAQDFPSHGRTIVLCLDGTGDKFDNDNSNIVHLVSCLKKDDMSQVTYYQAGIGTYGQGGRLTSGIAAALDMAFGSGLGLHVRDAYRFLMHTYKEGDKICIFGFSRGAYTARCLAGMVHKVGLLPPRNIAQIPFAYEFYKDDTKDGWTQSDLFKKTFCIDASVYFLGLFDSVASVGLVPRQLPLSSTPTTKSLHFRHAMSLDEHRSKFKLCRFRNKDTIDEEVWKVVTDVESHLSGSILRKRPDSSLTNGNSNPPQQETAHPAENKKGDGSGGFQRESGNTEAYHTDVLEVWFLGCHADVGGGAVANTERHKLASIPLRWMIRQSFECNTGILFNTKALAGVGLDVHTLWPEYTPLSVPVLGPPPSLMEQFLSHKRLPYDLSERSKKLVPVYNDPYPNHPHDKTDKKGEGFYELKIVDSDEDDDDENENEKGNRNGNGNKDGKNGNAANVKKKNYKWIPEQVEDYFDAMSDLNDQLVQARPWWILELWPVEYKLQKLDSDDWETRIGMNLGTFRAVEDAEPKLHWTVRHRMRNMGYQIRARYGRHASWRIVA